MAQDETQAVRFLGSGLGSLVFVESFGAAVVVVVRFDFDVGKHELKGLVGGPVVVTIVAVQLAAAQQNFPGLERVAADD